MLKHTPSSAYIEPGEENERVKIYVWNRQCFKQQQQQQQKTWQFVLSDAIQMVAFDVLFLILTFFPFDI